MRRMQSIALALFILFIKASFVHAEEIPAADGIYSQWRFNPNLVVNYPGEHIDTALTFRIWNTTITSYSFPVRSLDLNNSGSVFERGTKMRIQLGSGFSIITNVWTGPGFELPRGEHLSKAPSAYLERQVFGQTWNASQKDGGIAIGRRWGF